MIFYNFIFNPLLQCCVNMKDVRNHEFSVFQYSIFSVVVIEKSTPLTSRCAVLQKFVPMWRLHGVHHRR